jgi:hypothetical protein
MTTHINNFYTSKAGFKLKQQKLTAILASDPAGERASDHADSSGQGQASSDPDSMVQGTFRIQF